MEAKVPRFVVKVDPTRKEPILVGGVTRWPGQLILRTDNPGQALALVEDGGPAIMIFRGYSEESLNPDDLRKELLGGQFQARLSEDRTLGIQRQAAVETGVIPPSTPVTPPPSPAPPAQPAVVEGEKKSSEPAGASESGKSEDSTPPPPPAPPSSPASDPPPPPPAPPAPPAGGVLTLTGGDVFPKESDSMRQLVKFAARYNISEAEMAADGRNTKPERYAWLKKRFGL